MQRSSRLFPCFILASLVWLPLAALAQEYGAVQFPSNTTTQVGVPTENIFGRYYRAGVTEGPGQGPGVEAELGYGPDDGQHPTNNPAAWTWIPAVYNGDLGDNDDEYRARIIPPAPGSYDYAYRFRYEGGPWLYADMYPDGTEGGYSVPGDLTVELEQECLKWTQPPDCESGIDLPTFRLDPVEGEPRTVYLVADDWMCDGRPITHIRWWGSYPGYWTNGVPQFPPTDPQAGRPQGFRLTWYTDIPAEQSGTGYSMPGEVIDSLYAPLSPWQDPVAGQVVETYYCTVLNRDVPPGFEDEYQYDFTLPEPWNEKQGTIYWLSIEAIYAEGYQPQDPPPTAERTEFPEWGWKTTFETNLIDDAVVWVNGGGAGGPPVWSELAWPVFPYPGLFNPPGQTPLLYEQFTNQPPEQPSVNMAFELFTDICPRRDTKWSQMPDMKDGTDLWSWHIDGGEPQQGSPVVRADDFISDGRLITDIHWWGSYSNWMWWTNGTFSDPIAPPHDTGLKPVGFVLSWHRDAGCLPGEELKNIFVPIEQCHEMFYGTVTQRWVEPQPYYEHEYQYYVDLFAVDEPWPEEPGAHYWLNIDAVFPQGFVPSGDEGMHGGWGWKIAELPPDGIQMLCPPAVSNRLAGVGWQPDPGSLPPLHPRVLAGQPYDMAFELTTTEVDPNGTIVITNMAVTSISTGHVVKSVGTSGAGRQYLQSSTNLMTNAWTDVPGQVKIAPYPWPWRNTWSLPGPISTSNTFYRVVER